MLNRHGGINAAEVSRVLQRGGRFLTQQVDPADWPELRNYFPRMTDFSHNASARHRAVFERFGLSVMTERHDYKVAYASLEDLAFNLAVTPWTIPDLSPETDLDAFVALERSVTTADGLVLTRALYLLSAEKPGRDDKPGSLGSHQSNPPL